MSDPKYTDAPVRCDEILGKLEALERYIKLPMIFKYNKGLVKSVNGHKDDRTFSINLKKALVSLLHVEFQGKDPKTGRVDMFEKEEVDNKYYFCITNDILFSVVYREQFRYSHISERCKLKYMDCLKLSSPLNPEGDWH